MAQLSNKSLNILAIRFSAIGDVAMTVPLVDSFLRQYPQHHLTLISVPKHEALFRNLPSNFEFIGADVKREYHGIKGLKRLTSELAARNFDVVLDLHSVIRSRIVSLGLGLHGSRVYTIGKDRLGRKAVTRRLLKRERPLTSAFDRYAHVFEKAGMPVSLEFDSLFPEQPKAILELVGPKQGRWIGIAPFAAHQGKIYPVELMEKVVEGLESDDSCTRIFVFAYGKELEQVRHWEDKFGKLTLISGQYPFSQELELMNWLDVMVSMDSSNMHLASLAGTRVVSVWGATHPVAGFLGYGQKPEDCVQVDMGCRPCSIYGKKACRYGDWRCMTAITPQMILERIKADN